MAIVNGKGTTLQIGQEATWGVKASPSVALNYLSESFAFNPERKEEESLLGGKTSRAQDIMKLSVDSSSFDLIAKPENIGLVVGLALGNESAVETVDTGVYKHTFTPIAAGKNSSLPSFTAIIDRVIAAKAYTGLKVESISFKCDAGDYMRITVTCSGRNEEEGTISEVLEVPSLKAFRFAGGTCSFDGSDFGEITSVTVDYNNNLDDGAQTLGSGYFGTEKQPQQRDITVTLESFYNEETETIREEKYKKESTIAVVLNFESPSEIVEGTNYGIKFDMPLVCINSCQPNVSGAGKINLSIGGKALESKTEEALTVELTDSKETKYLA